MTAGQVSMHNIFPNYASGRHDPRAIVTFRLLGVFFYPYPESNLYHSTGAFEHQANHYILHSDMAMKVSFHVVVLEKLPLWSKALQLVPFQSSFRIVSRGIRSVASMESNTATGERCQ